jgi:hypothetical protein
MFVSNVELTTQEAKDLSNRTAIISKIKTKGKGIQVDSGGERSASIRR